jgi:hypothetical protein
VSDVVAGPVTGLMREGVTGLSVLCDDSAAEADGLACLLVMLPTPLCASGTAAWPPACAALLPLPLKASDRAREGKEARVRPVHGIPRTCDD